MNGLNPLLRGLLQVLRHPMGCLTELLCEKLHLLTHRVRGLASQLPLFAARRQQRRHEPPCFERDEPSRQRLPWACRQVACGMEVTMSLALEAARRGTLGDIRGGRIHRVSCRGSCVLRSAHDLVLDSDLSPSAIDV